MAKFTITLKDSTVYPLIEADSSEEAIEKALQWWIERIPTIKLTELENSHRHYHCPVNAWDCPYFSHTEKEPCLCALEHPMDDCDDFAACWDEYDEYWDDEPSEEES